MKQEDYIKHHSWQNNKPFPETDLKGNKLSLEEITMGKMLEKYGDMFWTQWHDTKEILLNTMYKSNQVHAERLDSIVFEKLTRTGLMQIEGGQSS